MKSVSPNIVRKLLKKFCKADLWEAIEGDLNELFLADLERRGKRKAQINYFLNALAFLRYHRLRKNKNSKTLTNMSLIKNYVKVSVRDLKRNKIFTGINLVGLVAGMTVSILMLQYVLFETSFDTFHDDYDRIYRVINDRYQNGELVQHGTITYPTIGPTLVADFPEIESYTRLTYNTRNYVEYEDDLIMTNNFLIADEHFPLFFSFEMIAGEKEDCLNTAFKVVLTESFAKKLIGSNSSITDLMGKTVTLYGAPCEITGILADPPENSHLQFEMLISYKTFIAMAGDGADNSWEWSDFYHYVKLKDGIESSSLSSKLADFGVRYFKQGEVSGGEEKFHLQPLSDTHFDPSMEYEIGNVTNGKIVWLMLAIAVFIIIIAWINYINLNTSRAIQRAKEIGIRKSVGAQKGQIIGQFFIETILLNFLALFISVLAVLLLQPSFNQLTGLDLSMSILGVSSVGGIPFPLLFLVILSSLLTLVALYPAFLVMRFSTQDILKGSFKLKGEITWLRKGMVIFQFCTAVVLITAATAVGRQIDFMVNQNLGINIDNTMVIYGPEMTDWDSTFINKIDRFKSDVQKLSGVEIATASGRVLGSRMGRIFQIQSSSNPEDPNLTSNFFSTDHDFFDLYDVGMLAGRAFDVNDHNFDPDLVKNIVINKSAANLLNYNPDEAVGRTVTFWSKDWTIIGVTDDFHQLSLHEKIEPIFLIPYYDTSNSFSVKLTSDPTEALVSSVENKFNAHFPGNYFDYYYLEDQVAQLYNEDIRVGKVSKIFTILSILIAVLGLYGLVMMTLVRKTREIGMRKVLGANLGQLLLSISKEFILLVLIAVVIGAPISYFAVLEWKAGFAYSIDMGFGLILGASAILLLISILTIVFQTKRISRNNPVESLRCE
ncbi:MAG: ABC transporter permease [Cyclobacteriaceae bacterium]